MLSVTDRSAPLLGPACTSMVPSPRPDAGASLIQDASEEADQSHALWVRISIAARAPEWSSVPVGAVTVYRHAAPAWVISACCSAMAIVAFRATGSPFALTLTVMTPSPWPSLPERISIHAADVDDDHAHSRATDTCTSPVPPVEPKLDDGFVIEIWQRAAVGPVTLVTALLPQAAAAVVMSNRRARARMFTPNALQVALQRQ